jgi:hypothetical protein
MVAKLKMVCSECCCKIRRSFEKVKHFDTIGAIRSCLEILVAQEQLDRLSEVIKSKYTDVFSTIPHLDELPMDIFCRIKLKDQLMLLF